MWDFLTFKMGGRAKSQFKLGTTCSDMSLSRKKKVNNVKGESENKRVNVTEYGNPKIMIVFISRLM